MSHEIETFGDGSAAFVSARQDAWHRLGTVLPDCFSADEAMRRAFLGGWNVHKESLTATVLGDQGVSTLTVPEHYATVRTHPKTGRPEILGVVGPQYQPVQNEQHCELLDMLVDESGAHFETAGSLRGGRQVFVTMKLPKTMRVGGVDDVDLYIAALNSHDGSTSFRLIVTPVRIVCANTQALALRSARSSYAIRHTSGVKGRIEQARQALRLTWTYVDAFNAEAEKMINETLQPDQFRKVTSTLFPLPADPSDLQKRRNAEALRTLDYLFSTADTQKAIRGTRWAGYQAVVEYVDHASPVKTRGDKAEARAMRTLTAGWVTDLKQRAYELLTV